MDINGKPVIDDSVGYITATLPKGGSAAAPVVLFNITTKPGKRAYLVKIGNAAGSGGESSCFFSVQLNGSNMRLADNVQNMISSPANDFERLARFVELPQCADVSAVAYNTSSTTDYAYTAKVVILYVDL